MSDELNPLYEGKTYGKLPEYDKSKSSVVPETDMDKLNRFLINIAHMDRVGIRRKILIIEKFIEVMLKENIKN